MPSSAITPLVFGMRHHVEMVGPVAATIHAQMVDFISIRNSPDREAMQICHLLALPDKPVAMVVAATVSF